MRKDFSFQINLNNPGNPEERAAQSAEGKQKQKELFTQKNEKGDKNDQGQGLLDRFGLSFIGGGSVSNPKSEYAAIDESIVAAYIRRFAQVAVSERKKYGVPSSIILANAIYHGFAGSRDIAQSSNNHFALTCTTDWSGQSKNYQDMCYRQYENAWTSFRDHSLFVTSGKYAQLLKLGTSDYKSWAEGLEKAGFSEFDDLAKNLVQIIEKYELHQLDIQ